MPSLMVTAVVESFGPELSVPGPAGLIAMPFLVQVVRATPRCTTTLRRCTRVPRLPTVAVGTLRFGSVGRALGTLRRRGIAALVVLVLGVAAGCSYTLAPMPRPGAVGATAAD